MDGDSPIGWDVERTNEAMSELQRQRLYDARNPASPLPTSLRPQLNTALEAEGVDEPACRLAFRALGGGGGGQLTRARLELTFREATGGGPLDYYTFQALVGRETRVVWPQL